MEEILTSTDARIFFTAKTYMEYLVCMIDQATIYSLFIHN